MKKCTCSIIFFAVILNVQAQKVLSEGAALLFKNIKSSLPAEDRNSLFKKSGFVLSKDKKQFVIAASEGMMDYPFPAFVFPTDMNKDGKEEIFVIFGNGYTSGQTGSSLLLFIKDKTGNYQTNFGFSGAMPVIMPTKNGGYPDLLIGGPGFEFPVWRWNGKEYVYYRKITDKSLGKLKTSSIEDESRIYCNALR